MRKRRMLSIRQKSTRSHLPGTETQSVTSLGAASELSLTTSVDTEESYRSNFSPEESLSRELSHFDADDWYLLRANDTNIREQRRVAGIDGLPREYKSDDVRYGDTSRLGQSTLSIVEFDNNDANMFFDPYSWKDQDYEYDEAQIQFEKEIANELHQFPPDDMPDDVEKAIAEVADDWFDGADESADSEDSSGFEWDELAFDADEFEEVPERADLIEVRTDGRVSREGRALQKATELAEMYGWDERGRELLTIVFNRYFWSAAKGAMKRELEKGMTPDELELALGLRDFWKERTEFSIDINYWRRSAWSVSDTSHATYQILSWPAALRLIRLANTIPDQAEIEALLDELYLEWYSSRSLQSRYPSFRVYLYRWIDSIAGRSDVVGIWYANVDAIPGKEIFGDDDYESTWLVHHQYELAQQGLLPTENRDPYVEWMSRVERKVLGEALTERSERFP